VFPGQGSQSIGMMNGYGEHPVLAETIARASDCLGQDIGKLIDEGPAEELNQTVNTQPVMVTAAYAVYRLWCALGGPAPSVLAGHSLGEYSALVVAGAISFEDCLPLVRFRAQAMQDAVPVGSGCMAAVLGLDDAIIREACAEAAQGEVVEAVNFNAPAQVVIAGHASAVARAGEALKARGAKRVVALAVSAPFHSSLMAPAAAKLRERLATVFIAAPQIPVLQNFDVAVHSSPEGIRAALVSQADHPVPWADTVRKMAADGVRLLLECGPGKVLAPLAKRIDEAMAGVALADRTAIESAIKQVKERS
jgi:[acyl-carrier-protein] S-malonyltransferase